MSNNIDQTLASAIVTALTGGAALSITGPVKLRLTSTTPTATAAGTEITAGGGYTTGGVTTAGAWGTASAGSITNSAAAIGWTNMPSAPTIAGCELWDSAGTPKRVAWSAITSSAAGGINFNFPTSTLTLTLN